MPYIYVLKNKTSDDVYYGSTKRKLKVRFTEHKYSYSVGRGTSSRHILQCPSAYIELIEEVSEEQMKVRERWWIENNPCVNKEIPTRTLKEWKVQYERTHREEINAYARKYRASLRQNLCSKDLTIQSV